ncbi:MAG: hypothetical protein V1798_04480 [Pseudomonadota bacterium]
MRERTLKTFLVSFGVLCSLCLGCGADRALAPIQSDSHRADGQFLLARQIAEDDGSDGGGCVCPAYADFVLGMVTTPGQPPTELFTCGFEGSQRQRFVVRITDCNQICQAMANIGRPNGHVGGIVMRSTSDFNPGWNFHLLPPSVEIFENSTEVCDGTLCSVNANTGGLFPEGSRWCPWDSVLVRML